MLPATTDSSHTTHDVGTSTGISVDSYHQVQEINPINNNSKSSYNYHANTTAATTEQYRQDVDNCTSQSDEYYSIMQNNNHQQQLLHISAPASSTTTTTLQTNYYQQQHNIPPPFSTDNNNNIKFSEVITTHTDVQNNRNNPFVYNNNNNSNSYQYNEIDCESSSSSFLFLQRDDQTYHYTNFLTPDNKKELLTTMLSEMSFWETLSTSTQQVQDRHHPNQRQQQQQQQQPSSVRTPATRTSLVAPFQNDPRIQVNTSASDQRQQKEPYSGTYSNIISRFRNGNTSNSRDSTAGDSNVDKKVEKTSSPVKAAIPKTASGLSVKKLSSTNGSNHRSTSSTSATIITGRPKTIGSAAAANEDDLLNKELDALDPSKISWKHAVDPATGRVYYYDSITRKTQWEKPREIRLLEKKTKRDLRRADIAFFRIMEQNLINSLRRGEKIPCISPDHYSKEGPPCEPTTSPIQTHSNSIDEPQHMQQNSGNDKIIMNISKTASKQSNAKSSRVRTISGMDHHVLAQLGSTIHTIPNTTTCSAIPVSSSTNNGSSITSNIKSSSTASARPSSSTGNKSIGTINVRLPSNVHQNDVTGGPTGAGLPLIEGRPPLAQRRSSTTSTSSAVTQQQHISTIAPQQSSGSSLSTVDDTMDSLELSPDADDFGAKTVDMELRGVDLLLDDGSTEDDMGENGNNDNKSSIANPAKSPTVNVTNHVRRHTGNTMHFDTTMDNPNIDATMQCVCGVFRAHIVQAAELQQTVPPSQQQQSYNPALDVFRDDYEQYCLSIAKGGSGAAFYRTHRPAVPSLIEIKAFYNEFYQRSQMEHDTIIMSLIYVERLMKDTNGALTPNTYNWRSVLFSCMILASKVWDDLSMWNIDFSNVSVAASSSSNLLSAFSLQRINQLELAVLSNLSFRTAIPASEYAKYYFLIRTMLMRSGILKGRVSSNGDNSNGNHSLGGIFRTTQQEAEAANRLENRSSLYQENLSSLPSSVAIGTNHQQQQLPNSSSSRGDSNTSTGTHRAAARSIDWSYFMSRGGGNNNNAGETNVVEATVTAPNATATGSNDDTAFPPVVINDIATSARMLNDITASTSARIGPVLHDTVCLKQIVSSG